MKKAQNDIDFIHSIMNQTISVAQKREAAIGCAILYRMLDIGSLCRLHLDRISCKRRKCPCFRFMQQSRENPKREEGITKSLNDEDIRLNHMLIFSLFKLEYY